MTQTRPAHTSISPAPGAAAAAVGRTAGAGRRIGHMPELTGLRGVAALWVVALHAYGYHTYATGVADHPLGTYFAQFGWIGVDVFFVLSGFLLALPLLARVGQPMDRGRWHRYLVSRFTRIVPPYYGSLLLVVLLVALQPQMQVDRVYLLRHLAFVHTFWSDSLLSLNPVAWTLVIEVQFYLLLPLLVPLFVGRRWIATTCGAIILVLGYGTFAYEFAGGQHKGLLFLHLPAFALHFTLGILAARAYLSGWRPPVPGRWLVPLAVASFGLLPVVTIENDWLPAALDDRLGWIILRPLVGVAAVVVIYSVATQASWAARVLRTPVLLHMGAISYSLYLLHMPVLGWFAINGPVLHGWGFSAYLALAIGISWAASVGFYQVVERPSLALKALWLERRTARAPPAGSTGSVLASPIEPQPVRDE